MRPHRIRMTSLVFGALLLGLMPAAAQSVSPAPAASPLVSADLYKLRSVADVQIAPDGKTIAYSIQQSDRPGRPYAQAWLMDLASGQSKRLGGDHEGASGPRWSPDGSHLAFFGRGTEQEGAGLMVSDRDGANVTFIATVTGTNHPLPTSGDRFTWSPDGKRIAFVSATPGPEADANGDPMVITRYLYKPTASEGLTHFNDNKRIHIFVADLASKQITQLTDGVYYEHSLDWSPAGDEILFISNRGPDPDRFFNYDVFTVNAATKAVRRLTDTKNAEYRPRWSPDGRRIVYQGTKRPLTSSETTMEDTHVWVMDASGQNRKEIGESLDLRQGAPEWAADGKAIYFTAQDRGNVTLYRLPIAGGQPAVVVHDAGSVGSWSLDAQGHVALAFSTPTRPAEMYLADSSSSSSGGAKGPGKALTSLNDEVLQGKTLGETEELTFKSFDGTAIGAYLTKPADGTGGGKHPLIVMIHGGPHGAQGPAFNSKAQVYAGIGWATLMVNFRGSTGYGQKLADAIFKDQDGGEAKDVLAGVDAALTKYPWIDANKLGVEGGSYGGQLTEWLVTQTTRFKAAVPAAGISNLVSFNYMSYYHDYLAVEFGAFPHQQNLMDLLWQRSALRYVNKVQTPVMLVHGENDNDVPIAEAEQFYIALRDVGVDAVLVRYPREGHGVRETRHVIDVIDRSIAWYARYFDKPAAPPSAPATQSSH
jgi:dipeptidyl aminopeptidase/acylaminoacyl peptidase